MLIFMDIEMPSMDGVSTAKNLLQINSSLKIIPCSGYKITNESI